MQVFKLYMKILNKKRSTLFTYLLIFSIIWIGLSTINTKDINKANTPFRNTVISIAYIDQDHSDLSRSFTNYLKHTMKVKTIDSNEEALKDALFANEVNYIVMIPKGFEKHFLEQNSNFKLITQKKANATEAFLAEQKVESYLSSVSSYKKAAPSLSYQAIDKKIKKVYQQHAVISMVDQKDLSFKQEMNVMYFNTLGYILLSLMILIGASIMMSIFKSEVHIRTLASPISNTSFNLQLFLANIVFGTGIWLMFTLLSILLNTKEMLTMQGLLYTGNSFTMTMVALSFAFMAANLLRGVRNNMEAINGITNVFALGSCFICGNFVPQSVLSKQVLDVAAFLPNYWYVKINDLLPHFHSASIANWHSLLQGYGIQWLFVIVFFLLGIVISRTKQRVQNIT